MQFNALVEEYSTESMVFFRELPACFSVAATSELALQAAPAAITEYLRWLKINDIVLFENEVRAINVVLAERLRIADDQPGPRFEADLAAPTDQEIDNALNVCATARAEIIELYDEVPSTLRDTIQTPESWSLTQHLEHILKAEFWYVSCLSEQPETMPPVKMEDISMKLFENAMDNEIFLRELTPEQRARVFIRDRAEWTAAKTLRRMSGHLREHYPWMLQLTRQLREQK